MFKYLAYGNSLKDSFAEARYITMVYTENNGYEQQKPSSSNNLRELYLGEINEINNNPTIELENVISSDEEQRTMKLHAKIKINNVIEGNHYSAFAHINKISPEERINYDISDEQLNISMLETQELDCSHGDRCEKTIEYDFTEPPGYEIFYLVLQHDNDNNISNVFPIKYSIVNLLSAATLTLPRNGDRVRTNVDFRWKKVGGDNITYILLITDDYNDFDNSAKRYEIGDLPSTTNSGNFLDTKESAYVRIAVDSIDIKLIDGIRYYWRVDTYQNGVLHISSNISWFRTDDTNEPPTCYDDNGSIEDCPVPPELPEPPDLPEPPEEPPIPHPVDTHTQEMICLNYLKEYFRGTLKDTYSIGSAKVSETDLYVARLENIKNKHIYKTIAELILPEKKPSMVDAIYDHTIKKVAISENMLRIETTFDTLTIVNGKHVKDTLVEMKLMKRSELLEIPLIQWDEEGDLKLMANDPPKFELYFKCCLQDDDANYLLTYYKSKEGNPASVRYNILPESHPNCQL